MRMKTVRKVLFVILCVIGGFSALLLLAGLIFGLGISLLVSHGGRTPVAVAQGTVLSVDIGAGFPDAAPTNAWARLLFAGRPPLKDILDALERASNDPRVTGLIARVGDGEMGLAQAQELREAIAAFRAKGKRTVAYADSFSEFASGTHSYYLASAFDQIWLQPHGLVGLVGLRAEEPFFRGTLDKLGIEPRFDAREEYKSAADPIRRKTMTEPDREQLQALLDSVYGQIVDGISADRHLDPAVVRTLIDRGPFLAHEALDAHLIDRIGYSDEALSSLGVGPDDPKRPMSLERYLAAVGAPHTSGPTIALIYATGMIRRGSDGGGLLGSAAPGADQIIRAFRMAARDKSVRAILFRIDSPGGSAVASESIWRATVEAKRAGKKLVVSMGDVAGSGGYYIAAAADKIVADPATLTGSIGVLGGKIILSGLLEKLGASTSSVQDGADAGLGSSFEDFTPQEEARFEAFLDDVYAGFKDRVAEGRQMNQGQVDAVAKGRIWSGADAKSKGLVDDLGGFSDALAAAKAEAGIPVSSEVNLKLFPPPRTPLQVIADRIMGRDTDDEPVTGALANLIPVVTALRRLAAPDQTLLMAPITIH
jgi:protease IV